MKNEPNPKDYIKFFRSDCVITCLHSEFLLKGSLGKADLFLTYKNKDIREIAAHAPYDALILIANSKKYGGGGIYNLYATATVDTEPSGYVFVHEFDLNQNWKDFN